MGELTDVASAKRAVLGVLMDRPEEELDDVRALTKTWVFLIFSSGEVRWGFDMLSDLGADVGLLKSYVEGYINNENQLKHFTKGRIEAAAEPVAEETESKMKETAWYRKGGVTKASTLGFMWLKRSVELGLDLSTTNIDIDHVGMGELSKSVKDEKGRDGRCGRRP